ncbi:ABC transporter ATP-binding protein, partial [Pseudomonas sp. MWU13-2860]
PSVGVDPISRRELWKMVSELAADGMTVLWSTSYLDEAERCDEVLLMNAGQLAYAGTPGELIRRMEGRSVQLRGIAGNHRQALRRALRQPQVLDGVIQGQALRLVLRQAGQPPELSALQAGPDARFIVVPPRLEDAFIELLGGGPGGDSELAERMQPAQLPAGVDPDAVIRAKQLTRRFGD